MLSQRALSPAHCAAHTNSEVQLSNQPSEEVPALRHTGAHWLLGTQQVTPRPPPQDSSPTMMPLVQLLGTTATQAPPAPWQDPPPASPGFVKPASAKSQGTTVVPAHAAWQALQ